MSKTKTKTKTKPQLYNDLHPEKSLKNTGYKNHITAANTINMISKRSLKYQFDVINTMFNRAKYHPNKTKEMEDAMKIFNQWLKNYQKKKEIQDKKYKFLSLNQIEKYEKLADLFSVSEIARGIKKSTKTDKGFLQIYKQVDGKPYKLQYIPIKFNKPEGEDYYSYRINFINSRLAQIKNFNTPLYYKQGKYKGLPTKQHLILIMHAYSPDKLIY